MADEPAAGVKTDPETPAAVETPPEGQGQASEAEATPPENVPYERFSEVVEQLKAANEQMTQKDQANQGLLDQVSLYQANSQAARTTPQAATPAAQGPDSLYGDLVDDDVISVAESKKVTRQMYDAFSEELSINRFLATHSDYVELCGTPEKMGESFREAVIKNPAILTEIQAIPGTLNKMLRGYNYAKAAKDSAGGNKEKPSKEEVFISPAAQAVLDASKTPSSPAAVGAGTGGMGKGAHYATMNKEEILKRGQELAMRA